jgi:glycosyltransferase involved in cell wall biosynthesis
LTAESGHAELGIVVPARDAARFLERTLDGIAQQSFRDWICVVVDDGSSDDTRAIAADFASRDDRFVVLHQDHAGPCAARNRGMALLLERVEFLTFMDADDVWLPHAMTTLIGAARADPSAIGAHGLAEFIDECDEPLLPGVFAALGRLRLDCRGGWPRTCSRTVPTRFEHVVTQSILFPPGVMVARARVYRSVGPFDEAVRYAEDWDILIRLTRLGHLAFVDDVVLWYRRHDGNLGASPQVPLAVGRVRRKAFSATENSAEQHRIVRDAWRAAQVIDGRARLHDALRFVSERRWLDALAQVGRLPFLVARYLRGRPVPPSI